MIRTPMEGESDKMQRYKYVGLSDAEVLASRQKYGVNLLTPKEKTALWRLLLEKFRDPIILILLVALLLSFGVAVYHYFFLHEGGSVFFEPAGILLAIALATGIAFYFELKANREFEVLNLVNDDTAYKVLRNARIVEVAKRDLVVDDLLFLETGEEVPADALLLEEVSLQMGEASLTGEPMVRKSVDPAQFDAEATYPSNKIYRGTNVLEGHCVCRIERVGDATEYGKVFEGVQVDNSIETPLNIQLNRLAKLISKLSYLIAALVLLGRTLVYLQDLEGAIDWTHFSSYLLSTLMLAVTVIVVAVPEGLPMSVTLSLAYSMRSMMKSGNLVRRMHACETMGAATVICTDKTGTLTQNRMTVADVFTLDRGEDRPDYKLWAEAIAVNSTAYLDEAKDANEQSSVLGNPTEGALLLWVKSLGFDYLYLRQQSNLLEQLTFSTERKYMATIVRSAQHGGKAVLYVKGAPEILFSFCQMSATERQLYQEQLQKYQSQARRTIALAYKVLEPNEENCIAQSRLTIDGLTLMGLFAISDPLRSDVPAAIEQCLEAGIDVKIITGDTSGTAKEIARQIGLWNDELPNDSIITGTEFAALSDEDLLPRVQSIRIMSRARPSDKARLVRLLQERGEVVAVTGDGTNDAPALSQAQVGLSMGDGTAVAKEASDMTILDNSFASIARAVMWGRSLYLNIQRFIVFQMTINITACLIVLIGAFLGTESPLTVTQMLWVNLIMDTFAALALASLPPSQEVMKAKPRRAKEHIITPSMLKRILGVGVFFVLLLFAVLQVFRSHDLTTLSQVQMPSISDLMNTSEHHGLSSYELSLFFALFVFLQFWNMFNSKAYKSGASAFQGLTRQRPFLLIASCIVLGQLLISSFGGALFSVQPLRASDWLWIILGTMPVLLIGEAYRFLKHSGAQV